MVGEGKERKKEGRKEREGRVGKKEKEKRKKERRRKEGGQARKRKKKERRKGRKEGRKRNNIVQCPSCTTQLRGGERQQKSWKHNPGKPQCVKG
jgi:hypothetical protein